MSQDALGGPIDTRQVQNNGAVSVGGTRKTDRFVRAVIKKRSRVYSSTIDFKIET